jgi:hypothetical protein
MSPCREQRVTGAGAWRVDSPCTGGLRWCFRTAATVARKLRILNLHGHSDMSISLPMRFRS